VANPSARGRICVPDPDGFLKGPGLGPTSSTNAKQNSRSPALQSSLRPVVPAYPSCYIPTRHSRPMPRPTALLTSSTTIPSQPSAAHSAHHRFFSPLFSAPSELLFEQLPYFHKRLRCPLVFSATALRFSRITGPRVAIHVFSIACALFVSLCALFRTRVLSFQSFTDSFAKTGGVGVCVRLFL
jgi:hypothetical protein